MRHSKGIAVKFNLWKSALTFIGILVVGVAFLLVQAAPGLVYAAWK